VNFVTITQAVDMLRSEVERTVAQGHDEAMAQMREWRSTATLHEEQIRSGDERNATALSLVIQRLEELVEQESARWGQVAAEKELVGRDEQLALTQGVKDDADKLRAEFKTDRMGLLAQVDIQLASVRQSEHERLRSTLKDHEALIMKEVKVVYEDSLQHMEKLNMKQWSEGVREMRQLVDTRCEAFLRWAASL